MKKRILDFIGLFTPVLVVCLLSICSEMTQANMDRDVPQTFDLFRRPDGVFVSYLFETDTTYRLQWGNTNFTSTSKLVFATPGSGLLALADSDKMFILLNQSCGTRHIQTVVLPMTQGKSEEVRDNVIGYDRTNHLIAFVEEDSLDLFVHMEDLESGRQEIMKIESLCPAAEKMECIDSTSFINGALYVRWHGTNWSRARADLQERTFVFASPKGGAAKKPKQ